MAKAKGPNWAAIKAEYLRGGTSYRKLAEKHGIKVDTLEKRAKRESWRDDLRKVSGEFQAELPHRIAAVILDEATAIATRHFHLFDLGLKLAEGMINRRHQVETEDGDMVWEPLIDNPKDLDRWMAAIERGAKGQRLARGMDLTKANPADEADFDGSLFDGSPGDAG